MEFWLIFIIVCWLISEYKYRTSKFKGKDRTQFFVTDRTEPKPNKPDPKRDDKIKRFISTYQSFSSKDSTADTFVNPMQYTNQFCSAEEKLAYMHTAQWQTLKEQRLELANYCCEVEGCTETINLHLHHITYERLLNERLSDLRIVCSKHHQAVHDKLGYDRRTLYPIN